MNVYVRLPNQESDLAYRHLKNYLEDSHLEGLDQVERLSRPPGDDELGQEWLDWLQIVFSSAILETVIAKVIDWKTRRKVEAEIEVEFEGSRIRVKSDNIEEAVKHARELLELARETPPQANEAPDELELKPLPHERNEKPK